MFSSICTGIQIGQLQENWFVTYGSIWRNKLMLYNISKLKIKLTLEHAEFFQ